MAAAEYPCHVADNHCEAPAGWRTGRGTYEGTRNAKYRCADCGEPVCRRCSKGQVRTKNKVCSQVRVCHVCLEDQERDHELR